MLTKKFLKTKDVCDVTFEYDGDVETAALAGDFNNWEPQPMKKTKKAGSPFRAKVRLPKDGEFEFRYLIDGENWENDTAADAYRTNEHGSENGVVLTTA